MKLVWNLVGVLLLGFLAFGLWGCSNSNPIDSTPATTSSAGFAAYLAVGDAVQYSGTITEIDAANSILICSGIDYPVIVPEDCDIAKVDQGDIIDLTFADLAVGDSVKVCGIYQEDETILANRIRVCVVPVCPDYDVALHEEITDIDYGAGTFTVANRTETFVIDENTTIWGVNTHYDGNADTETGSTGTGNGFLKIIPDQYNRVTHIALAFTDLKVGDVVEVKAYYTDDPTVLRAAVIKLANEYNACRCIFITAPLASIDCDTRMVTFDGIDWAGYVCPGALLLDADGNEMVLCDFSVGDVVSAKGFALDETTLQLTSMILE